jgi:hypothetical protein
MATPSTATDKAALLCMVVGESFHYMILRIWDGRFAAFYKSGFETEHCTAVAQHQIYDAGWPFAFIGDSCDAVMQWAIEADSEE